MNQAAGTSGKRKHVPCVRVSAVCTHAVNVLFVQCLKSWRDQARADNNSNLQHNYARALRSLAACALPLNSGTEATTLVMHVGPAIGKKLQKALDEAHAEFGTPLTLQHVQPKKRTALARPTHSPPPSKIIHKQNNTTNTVPQPVSLPQPGLSRTTSSFFDRIRPTGDYTNLREQQASTSSTASTSNTSTSTSAYKRTVSAPTLTKLPSINTANSSPFEPFTLEAGTFDVVLLVDNQENSGRAKYKRNDMFAVLQKMKGLMLERRQLVVGDYLWVARSRLYPHKQLVLDLLVERKRMDDLASSIKDERYKEQKQRIKACGFTERIYLIEKHADKTFTEIEHKALRTALASSQMHDKFTVQVTENTRECADYIQVLHSQITNQYINHTLIACPADQWLQSVEERANTGPSQNTRIALMPFSELHQIGKKSPPMSACQVLRRQLMVVRGVSAAKVNAIAAIYSTWTQLIEAYSACADANEQQKMLASIVFDGASGRKIGDACSRQLARFFTAHLNTTDNTI